MTDATVPEARSDATLRKFALRRLRLPVGAGVLSLVVPDAGDWIRRGTWTAGRLRGGEPPYWVQIWPASLRLAQLVARRRGLGGVSVLDLGCGLGLPGIASARCGASVTFVDREADALAFAVWNARRVLPVVPPESQRLDWSTATVQGSFDVVLLADVTYRAIHHVAVRRQLASCLAEGAVVLHADPVRPESVPFVSQLKREFVVIESTKDVHLTGRRVPVRLCMAACRREDLDPWLAAMEGSLAEGDRKIAL